MRPTLLVAGAVLALAGTALSASFTFAGPTFPETPVEVGGWGLLLVGLALLRAGARD